MQRLHDKVSGNWQKFTTMEYEINKSRDLKKENRKSHRKKVFEFMIMTEKRMPWYMYMHIIFLTKILGFFAVSLNPIIIQTTISWYQEFLALISRKIFLEIKEWISWISWCQKGRIWVTLYYFFGIPWYQKVNFFLSRFRFLDIKMWSIKHWWFL